jgi:hypothetical protein
MYQLRAHALCLCQPVDCCDATGASRAARVCTGSCITSVSSTRRDHILTGVEKRGVVIHKEELDDWLRENIRGGFGEFALDPRGSPDVVGESSGTLVTVGLIFRNWVALAEAEDDIGVGGKAPGEGVDVDGREDMLLIACLMPCKRSVLGRRCSGRFLVGELGVGERE